MPGFRRHSQQLLAEVADEHLHLLEAVELGQVEDGRASRQEDGPRRLGAGLRADGGELGVRGADREVELLSQRHQLPLRIEHDLPHLAVGLLQQPSHQPGFAAARPCLDQQASGEQPAQVQHGRPRGGLSDLDEARLDGGHSRAGACTLQFLQVGMDVIASHGVAPVKPPGRPPAASRSGQRSPRR